MLGGRSEFVPDYRVLHVGKYSGRLHEFTLGFVLLREEVDLHCDDPAVSGGWNS
jgi:hypothetical protein